MVLGMVLSNWWNADQTVAFSSAGFLSSVTASGSRLSSWRVARDGRTEWARSPLVGPCPPLPEPNVLVRGFSRIRFYDERAEDPYRTYDYPHSSWAGSDAQYQHQLSDGTWERLFVESPDRPFYLERDDDDPELARIVITFVPSAETGAERAGDRSLVRR